MSKKPKKLSDFGWTEGPTDRPTDRHRRMGRDVTDVPGVQPEVASDPKYYQNSNVKKDKSLFQVKF